jgi:non-ribosomal peptide synthetase component F
LRFALQNAPLPAVELPGLKQVRLDAEVLTTRFDLTLALSEDHNRLQASWEYSTELFDSETIARMDRGFKLLLRAIVERPETPISRLPFPSLGSRGQAPAVNDVAAAILQDAAVVDCVVLSRPAGDEIRLVAYMVAPAGVFARQLRERLRSLLPQDVCDRIAIVPVAAIPLRASGRVDEAALESLQVIDDEVD